MPLKPDTEETTETKRFSLDDLPKPKRRRTVVAVAEKLIDKLSAWQLFCLMVLAIVAYTLLNWT